MSDRIERAKALEEAFTSDEAFATEFRSAIEARSAEDAIRLAAAKGIELTPDDFAPDDASLQGRELDESELDAVAGGGWDDVTDGLSCVIYFLVARSS